MPAMDIRQSFEADLRKKLGQRAKNETAEANTLLNAFKFFDLSNCGLIQRHQWVRTFGKLGLVGYSEKELTYLFDIYDINGQQQVDYKSFITDLYPNLKHGGFVSHVSQTSRQGAHTSEQSHPGEDAELEKVLSRLKNKLKERGIQTIVNISRAFRIMDDSGDKKLDYYEFQKGMRDYGMNLKESDLAALFRFFDTDRTGKINYEEFLSIIRGKMNDYRKSIVEKVFNEIDYNHNGALDFEDLKRRYDASKHPDVLSGKRSESDIYYDFLLTFKKDLLSGKDTNNYISKEDFLNYYDTVSDSITDDEYFRVMMENCWRNKNNSMKKAEYLYEDDRGGHFDGHQQHKGMQANQGFARDYRKQQESNFRHNSYNPLTNSYANESRQHKLNRPQNLDQMPNAYNQQNFKMNQPLTQQKRPVIQGNNSSFNLGFSQDFQPSSRRVPMQNCVNSHNMASQNVGLSQSEVYGNTNLSSKSRSNPDHYNYYSINRSNEVLKKFRLKLQNRGTKGINCLGRMFKIADDDGSHSIDSREFANLIADYRMGFNEEEIAILYKTFDRDGKGFVDYDEFLRGVVGEMNSYRKDIVKKVFAKLDKNQNRILERSDVRGLYNAARHPDVISGKKTEDDVLADWLDNFDQYSYLKNDAKRNHKVTFDEFLEYYNNISMSIDSDEYFSLMMNNCWDLDGRPGKGRAGSQIMNANNKVYHF